MRDEGNSGTTPAQLRLVVVASAAGTAFEWYDFFVYAPLAVLIQKNFFSGLSDSAGFIFALGVFAAGFAFRPVGALIFGRMGDRKGRKGAFLITMSLMGAATFAIGLLPTYQQAGIIAPGLLILLRISQGIALGGEWGGAAIYIAEHAPPGRRGFLTSFIGSAAAVGLVGALLVTLAARTVTGEDAFATWGWRIPFLFSALLLGISLWIRLRLSESPTFTLMRKEGRTSAAPYSEAFGTWRNLKTVLIALFSVMGAQGAIWYTTFFYGQTFLDKVVHVPPVAVNRLMIVLALISAPLYVFFGWLSDRIGRKPVMIAGMAIALVGLSPVFHAMLAEGNPALSRATRAAPVIVTADPRECSLQFDPIGKRQFRTSCDIAKSILTNAGIGYTSRDAPRGMVARIGIGAHEIVSIDGRLLDPAGLKSARTKVEGAIKTALADAGYPSQVDPHLVDFGGIFWPLMILVIGACALYGPQAATLVELFPTQIRYTALSLPYHIGTGWVGGFLPATAFAMVAATGDIFYGLWYPAVVTTVSIIVALIFLPETFRRRLDE